MLNKSKVNFNLIIIIYTFLLMLFCTNSSPIINFTSIDSSVFFAIGRAMTKGKIMFKELFDHKGFYLYLFNYIAALISFKSALGIFIVETCFMTISALIIFKTCKIFYDDNKTAFLAMAALMLLVLRTETYEGGNLTETYNIALEFIAIYLLLKDLYKENSQHRPLLMLGQGILAGIAIGLRPNGALMWLPVGLLIGFDLLFIKRDLKLFCKNLIYGLCGLAIALAPVIIYCVINNALDDMIFCSFKFNMLYMDGGLNFIILLKRMIGAAARSSQRILFVIIFISALYILKSKNYKDKYNKLYYFAMLAACLAAVALSGRRYGHYYEYIIPFCLPAVIEISAKVIELQPNLNYKYKYLILIIFAATCFAQAVLIPQKLLEAFGIYQAVGISKVNAGISNSMDEVIKKCSEININQKYFAPDEKILITGIINTARFYNEMGVIPSEKYFYAPSIPYNIFPDAIDAQIKSILSLKNDVIIIPYDNDAKNIYPAANKDDEIKEVLNNNYNLLFADEDNKVAMYGKKKF